jgi:DNA-binding transcriptional regulator YiaG/tetratricopeptide (TPR) repeat protein
MPPVRAYAPNIRLQQHRARLDLTQEAVAEELARLAWVHHGVRVGINADMVGKWERGEKRPSKLYRRLLCLLYQATEEELGFRNPVGAEQLGVRGTAVKRRDFLRHGAVVGAAMLTPLDWLAALDHGEVGDRLAWALERPSRIDLATTADMEAITAAHRRSYRQLSVQTLLPQAVGQFEAVTELLQRSQPIALRQRLVATAGQTAMLAGVLEFMDRYDFHLGQRHLDLAMTAAREAEARELGSFILGCMSFHARYSGKRTEAVTLIEQARDAARVVGGPLTQGWLAAVAAEVHAVAGESDASLHALEQAAHALEQAGEDDEASWIGVGTFNQAKLAAYHGVCYLQLGRPGDALPALTQALDSLDPALRKHRCTALADLATALVQLREIEEGCERACQSLAIATELGHAVSVDRIRRLRRRLQPWHRHPAVRRLDEQLAAALV